MKITLLTPDASGNCLGRALVLAEALALQHQVEIVGPRFGAAVWGPAAETSCELKSIPLGYGPLDATRLRRLDALVTGDVLLASKPLTTSFGVGLRLARERGLPLILDVDDWESGFCRDRWQRSGWIGKARYVASSIWRPHWTLSLLNSPYWEKRAAHADAQTVSNSFLQSRFGGERVWHGRDTNAFDPQRQDRRAARARHNLPADWKLVTYLGTMTPYKGLEDLIDAVASIARPEVRLLLIGAGEDLHSRNAVAQARTRLGDRCTVLGRQPLAKVPELLSMADVVVIPQRRNPATVGQMPAKLFDAMAAARPVVATDVSDIRECLEGCGWVVPPGEPVALAEAIQAALANPDEARRRAQAARIRAIERFSYGAMAKTLNSVLRSIQDRPNREKTA